MTPSEIDINDAPESFGRVWVHVQNVDGKTCVPYRVRMAWGAVDFVIGLEDKDASVSWDQYLREEVRELGSAGLSLYFLKLRTLSGADDREQPRWVIATLDAVTEGAHGIELQGRAIGFDPGRFLS